MQHHVVVGIGQGAENCLLSGRGFGQQGQGLVAVAGEDHLVEALDSSGAMQGHAVAITFDPAHRAIEADMLLEGFGQRRHIAAGAALDHAPLRPIAD